jgi:hypothetical protein
MNAEQILTRYMANGGLITPQTATSVKEPKIRHELYKALLDKPLKPFHSLLRHLLQEEVTFRKALENGNAEDDDDYFEGIYRCAFLLANCGDPADTLLLWKAKHTNMDVGCMMGAEYFVGAGASQTARFLEQREAKEAFQILEYVQDHFSQPDAIEWQKEWREERADNIRSA